MGIDTQTDVKEVKNVETGNGEIDSPANESLQKEIRDAVKSEVQAAANEIVAGQPDSTPPIDKRGSIVTMYIDRDESTTVPDGVYWKASVFFEDSTGRGELRVDAGDDASVPPRELPKSNVIFHGGTTITADSGSVMLQGGEV